VALSFDDGPHPELTPRVLDALAAAGGHGTFFLVGHNARRQPQLVRRIVQEGHAIGVHTDHHRHAWVSGPARLRAEMESGLQALMEIGGVRPLWFRPPWGAFNAATCPLAARLGLRIALWSCDAGDWLPGATPGAIARRVRRGVVPGAIIDLHDGGQTEAGCRAMTSALPAMLEAIHDAGLRAGHLGEMFGMPAHG
jgi:peptidoglycan/xylan/chitin deacetylase (PgdA/CDA1 family)